MSITGTAEGTAHLLSTRELSNQTQASWPQIQMSPVIAGVATFTGLKAGRYSFAVYGDNDTEATGEVDLVDGQVIRLDVTTRPRSHTGPQVVPEPEPSGAPF